MLSMFAPDVVARLRVPWSDPVILCALLGAALPAQDSRPAPQDGKPAPAGITVEVGLQTEPSVPPEEVRLALFWHARSSQVARTLGRRAYAADEDLQDAIAAAHAPWAERGKPHTPVVIDADPRIPWHELFRVLVLCQRIPIARIELARPSTSGIPSTIDPQTPQSRPHQPADPDVAAPGAASRPSATVAVLRHEAAATGPVCEASAGDLPCPDADHWRCSAGERRHALDEAGLRELARAWPPIVVQQLAEAGADSVAGARASVATRPAVAVTLFVEPQAPLALIHRLLEVCTDAGVARISVGLVAPPRAR